MKKLFTNLSFWVLFAIVIAILIGRFAPQIALQTIMDHPWKTKFL
jgi:aerobic C4-dicarboxylate transport protein